MDEKILFVDDDPNVLEGFQRQLRKRFHVETELEAVRALATIRRNGPYAVIVADMRMPYIDGIEFLTEVRSAAPESVRMMLTGNCDQHTAMEAVNQGRIFRFLTKPCPVETLVAALEAGIAQYRLITAEAELLEKTLTGSVKILTEILARSNPRAFGRSIRLRNYAQEVGWALDYREIWQMELAAMLAKIGQVALPASIAARADSGMPRLSEDAEMLARVPEISRDLLRQIPRLDPVGQIIYYQNQRFDGAGFPADGIAGVAIPLGSRILKILADLIELEDHGASRQSALGILRSREGWYDPVILDAVNAHLTIPAHGDLPIQDLSVTNEPYPLALSQS